MDIQASIYISDSNQIYLTLQGIAQGAVVFPDFNAFQRFVEGCQEFMNTHAPIPQAATPIPDYFLDAFDDRRNP